IALWLSDERGSATLVPSGWSSALKLGTRTARLGLAWGASAVTAVVLLPLMWGSGVLVELGATCGACAILTHNMQRSGNNSCATPTGEEALATGGLAAWVFFSMWMVTMLQPFVPL